MKFKLSIFLSVSKFMLKTLLFLRYKCFDYSFSLKIPNCIRRHIAPCKMLTLNNFVVKAQGEQGIFTVSFPYLVMYHSSVMNLDKMDMSVLTYVCVEN